MKNWLILFHFSDGLFQPQPSTFNNFGFWKCLLKSVYIPQSLSSEKKKKNKINFLIKYKKTGAKNLQQSVYLVSHSHALIPQLSSAPSYILELYQSQKVQLGERFSDSRILCHLCYYILLTHTLSLPYLFVCVHGGGSLSCLLSFPEWPLLSAYDGLYSAHRH